MMWCMGGQRSLLTIYLTKISKTAYDVRNGVLMLWVVLGAKKMLWGTKELTHNFFDKILTTAYDVRNSVDVVGDSGNENDAMGQRSLLTTFWTKYQKQRMMLEIEC